MLQHRPILSFAILFAFVTSPIISHSAIKDSIPSSTLMQQDLPDVAAIDQMLVSSYLNHYCFSADHSLLNAYGYEKTAVPSFDQEIVAERMRNLDRNSPFDLVYNQTVQGFIDLYAIRRRELTSKVMGLSELYFPLFEESLAKYKIPLEMKYLAIVESALNPVAISPAGAGGLWQFMVSTGKMYGLNVTSYQDDRFDPYKSTDAACRFLSFLYKTYGDWQLVLAAYNSGPGNVNKAIRRAGGKMDFWSIKPFLPKETQGYVPAFIAVNYVMNHATEYNLYPKTPMRSFFEVDSVHVNSRVDFNVLSKLIDMPLDDIRYLNGTYKLNEIPDNGNKHYLILPLDMLGLFLANEDVVYEQSKAAKWQPELMASNKEVAPDGKIAQVTWDTIWKTHKVKSKETLNTVAKRYGVSATEIKKWNKLKSSSVKKGQTLKIQTRVARTIYVDDNTKNNPVDITPDKSTVDDEDCYKENIKSEAQVTTPTAAVIKEEKAVEKTTPKPKSTSDKKFHSVKSGETLSSIAKKHKTTVNKLLSINKGIKASNIKVGQKVRVK
jgi:membrane-bound lytic murein transglycosylase D